MSAEDRAAYPPVTLMEPSAHAERSLTIIWDATGAPRGLCVDGT